MNANHSEGATASRSRFRAGLCAGILALAWQAAAWGEVLDFEEFSPGDIVGQVILDGFLNGTDGQIVVSAVTAPYDPDADPQQPNRAMVFNGDCGKPGFAKCSGNDRDLSAPGQGNILIPSRDFDSSDPDDLDMKGRRPDPDGIFLFDFTGIGAVTVQSLKVIDIEDPTANVVLVKYLGNDQFDTITVPIAPTGNAGIGTVTFGMDGMGEENVVGMSVNLAGDGAIDDLTFEAELVTFALECVTPGEGQCELFTKIDLPDNIFLQPTDTITQSAPDIFEDPRVNPATGRCDGGGAMPRGALTLFGGATGKPELVIPEFLCGSPRFAVLTIDKEFEVLSGTIEHEVDDVALVPGNGLICEDPIVPGSFDNLLYPDIIGDPQLSAVFGWQPKNKADVAEQRLIELTTGCINPTRSKTVDLSYITAGLHYDFGCTYAEDPECVFDSFIAVLGQKLHYLSLAVDAAQSALDNSTWVLMSTRARQIEDLFLASDFNQVDAKLDDFLFYAQSATFQPSPENHEGNILSRAENIRFIFDTRLVPFE